MISVIIPSYGRADRIREVIDNIKYATHGPFEIIVVIEKEQHDDYLKALGPGPEPGVLVLINDRTPGYAGAINTAMGWNKGEFVFAGADDVRFYAGWDDEALAVMHALPHLRVVGTNDLWNTYVLQGVHATHYLISADYINQVGGVIDGPPGVVLYEGYDHNFTDTEFIGTAKARAVFAPCLTSIVEHNHFTNGKSQKDLTYEKGYAHIVDDQTKYLHRRELWWNVSR